MNLNIFLLFQELPAIREAEETWYHPGPARLKDVRTYVLEYSVPQARQRLMREHRDSVDPAVLTAHRQEIAARLRSVSPAVLTAHRHEIAASLGSVGPAVLTAHWQEITARLRSAHAVSLSPCPVLHSISRMIN